MYIKNVGIVYKLALLFAVFRTKKQVDIVKKLDVNCNIKTMF